MTTPEPEKVAEAICWLIGMMSAVNEEGLDSDELSGPMVKDPPDVLPLVGAAGYLARHLVYELAMATDRSVADVLAELGQWAASSGDDLPG